MAFWKPKIIGGGRNLFSAYLLVAQRHVQRISANFAVHSHSFQKKAFSNLLNHPEEFSQRVVDVPYNTAKQRAKALKRRYRYQGDPNESLIGAQLAVLKPSDILGVPSTQDTYRQEADDVLENQKG